MPVALWALAIGGFGIGLTEFVIAGLLPEVATSFGVSEATAGSLISGYALAVAVGGLIGTKTVVNEFVAYQSLAGMLHQPAGSVLHHPISVVIATYALCGFSNFASIGIQIGGIAAMAPSRRQDVAALGLKAMFCGSLATFQTAAIAALVL